MYESLLNKPKTKRGEKTLARLVKSAEMNFYEKGYHETSIIDITKGADVALGTFYVYFASKISIYQYVLLQYSHRIRKQIAIDIKDIESRKDKERQGLKSFLSLIHKHKHMYNIIWESLYIDKNLFIQYYTSFGEHYETQIKEAQALGEMKMYNPTVVSFLLMGISNFIGLKYIVFDEEKDFDYVVDEVIRILDEGLFT